MWSILIYINSLSALIMGIIKLHPEAKQGFWPVRVLKMNLSLSFSDCEQAKKKKKPLQTTWQKEVCEGNLEELSCRVWNIFKTDSKHISKDQNQAEYGRQRVHIKVILSQLYNNPFFADIPQWEKLKETITLIMTGSCFVTLSGFTATVLTLNSNYSQGLSESLNKGEVKPLLRSQHRLKYCLKLATSEPVITK